MEDRVVDNDGAWEEIMGKDLVLKKLRNGEGNTAEMGTVVRCDLRGYFVVDGTPAEKPFEEWSAQSFKVGENDAVPGIEMAVRFSRVGDLMRVRFKSKFGYGYVGRPPVQRNESSENGKQADGESEAAKTTIVAIPPDSDLEYEISVTAHLAEGQTDPALLEKHPHVPGADSSTPERYADRMLALTELTQRKEAGNRWFSYGDFSRAARAYSKATQVADRYFNGNANVGDSNAKALQGLTTTAEGGSNADAVREAEERLAAAEREKEAQRRRYELGDEELVGVYVSCLNNMAAAQLRLGENAKAKDICVRVLEMDPGNHKALLRAAKAALATHDFEECDLCLRQLVAVAPAGSSAAVAAAAERKRLRQAQQDYREQNKKMSSNIVRQLGRPEKAQAAADSKPDSPSGSSAAPASAPAATAPPAGATAQTVLASENRSTSSDIGAQGGSQKTEASKGSAASAITAPAVAPAVAPVAAPAAGADRGLLLLLATSLIVLFVSVAMVLWGSPAASPRPAL